MADDPDEEDIDRMLRDMGLELPDAEADGEDDGKRPLDREKTGSRSSAGRWHDGKFRSVPFEPTHWTVNE